MVLVNVEQTAELAHEFVVASDVGLLCLLDEDGVVFNSYYRPDAGTSESPFPVRVVLDREGVILSIDRDIDPASTRAVIDEALAR